MLLCLFYDLFAKRDAVGVNYLTVATNLVGDVVGNSDVYGLIGKRELSGRPVVGELNRLSVCRGR